MKRSAHIAKLLTATAAFVACVLPPPTASGAAAMTKGFEQTAPPFVAFLRSKHLHAALKHINSTWT